MRDGLDSPRLAGLGTGLLLCFTLSACAGGRSDRDDEASPDTRTEIIYVIEDSLQDASDRPEASEGQPPESPPPTAGDRPSLVTSVDVRGESGERIPFDPEGEYTVQVGTLADSARAHERLRELRALGYPAYGLVSGKGIRIRIGYFARRDEAERFGKHFSGEQGAGFWVDRRPKESGNRL